MSQHIEPTYKGLEYETIINSPQKQQWAIINKYKALEFQKMKAKQRQIDRQKKQLFRRELDNQLNNRNNAEERQKQMDKMLWHRMNEKAQQMQRKQEIEKYEKYLKRKQIQEENMHNLEYSKLSKKKDYDTGYHLDIGMKSEQQHKEKSQFFKKNMMDTLDLQLKEKTEEAKRNKIINHQIEERHKQIFDGYFQPSQKKKYGQNQKIYEYYNQLQHQKQMKEKEMQYLMVDSPWQKKISEQRQRQRLEQLKKLKDKQIVKQTLNAQIRQSNKKRIQSSKVNPQEISYGFISNMFRSKEQPYDRDQYKKDLLKQAEEQRQRKIKENHMNEEQYRLNMNQLSKAVIGSYSQKNYLDRSLGAIGDSKKYQLDNIKYDGKDKDTDIIKNKLNALRNKNTISYTQQRKQYL